MMNLLKILICFILSFSLTDAFAQSNGDKLFLEGQQLQKTLTLKAQTQAIKKFQAAKVVYTTAGKKKMCDNQIAICNDNIKSIKRKTKPSSGTDNSKKKEHEESAGTSDTVKSSAPAARKDIRLTLSESRLDFKGKPKEGATQSVVVNCNYDDWEISSKPDWVTVYTATGKFSVEAQENGTDKERSGVIKVKCGDKEVDLVVNQAKPSILSKIGGALKKKR